MELVKVGIRLQVVLMPDAWSKYANFRKACRIVIGLSMQISGIEICMIVVEVCRFQEWRFVGLRLQTVMRLQCRMDENDSLTSRHQDPSISSPQV